MLKIIKNSIFGTFQLTLFKILKCYINFNDGIRVQHEKIFRTYAMTLRREFGVEPCYYLSHVDINSELNRISFDGPRDIMSDNVNPGELN